MAKIKEKHSEVPEQRPGNLSSIFNSSFSLNSSEVLGIMMEGKRVKSCSNEEVELDRISNLPDEVLLNILSKLPIEDGARTSVLSSKWRYKWAMVPHLVFEHLCPANVVDRVLLSHIGPITKFQLRRQTTDIDDMTDIEDMDRWILPISRHPISEFILKFHALQRYKMPYCLFSCQELVHLHLQGCLLEPPSTFEGFRSLKTLDLQFVTVAQDVFEHMIVGCPLLERLTLVFCVGFRNLKIDAPNLQYLFFCDDWDDFSFVNTLNLASVHIRFFNTRDHQISSNLLHSSSSLIKFFVGLPKVQSLCIMGSFLNYLACGALLEKLPEPCLHLKFLDISISCDEVEHVSTVICLMRSSPALETLHMYVQECEDKADVGAVNSLLDKNSSCSFSQLRHVKITHISGVEAELDFIRFLLISSPVLETMTIVPPEPHTTDALSSITSDADSADENENPDLAVLQNSFDLVKRLLRFRRASADLEIIFSDPEILNLEGRIRYLGP